MYGGSVIHDSRFYSDDTLILLYHHMGQFVILLVVTAIKNTLGNLVVKHKAICSRAVVLHNLRINVNSSHDSFFWNELVFHRLFLRILC